MMFRFAPLVHLSALVILGAFSCVSHAHMGVSSVAIAPEARNWAERNTQLKSAEHVHLHATIEGAPNTLLIVQRTTLGTWACVQTPQVRCGSLASVGVRILAEDLLDMLTARVPAGPVDVPVAGHRSWPLPQQTRWENAQAQYAQWSFNPEIGMPMPRRIILTPTTAHEFLQPNILRPEVVVLIDRFWIEPPPPRP